ncbi:acyl-CoA-binding protein-like [Sebastes umbrosus]|uniref:acyl-CoA-binding protein-like n=1 Tax=Sebastes umbrosus TaxID=72105 RepID=UPI00189F39F2|nr:acyl-CoA-binding protein-like [Sebastes umbrosus]
MTEICGKAVGDMKGLCELKEPFEKAVEDVKILKKRPGYTELGEIYGLYKQATAGDNEAPRPGIFDLAGRGKWDAWERRKGLSNEEAMIAYIVLVEEYKKKFGF